MVILLFFFVSHRLRSRIGDASYIARCVPTRFQYRFYTVFDKLSIFGDNMAEIADNFSIQLGGRY